MDSWCVNRNGEFVKITKNRQVRYSGEVLDVFFEMVGRIHDLEYERDELLAKLTALEKLSVDLTR